MDIDTNVLNSINTLGIDQNLAELIEAEKKYLINLFLIKEKIDEELGHINGLVTKNKELYDNLVLLDDELFSEFYKKYCGNRIPIDIVKKSIISSVMSGSNGCVDESVFDDFPVIDEYVRLNFGRLIFDGTSAEDIQFMLDGSILENEKFLGFIKSLVDRFICEKKDIIKNFICNPDNFDAIKNSFSLKDDSQIGDISLLCNDAFLENFFNAYADYAFEIIKSGSDDNPDADFDAVVNLIEVSFILLSEKERFVQSFLTFCEKKGPFDSAEQEIHHGYDGLFNKTKSIFKTFGKSCNVELSDIDLDTIDENFFEHFFNFMRKVFNELDLGDLIIFGEKLKTYDVDIIVDYTEQMYESHKDTIFLYWKKYFVSELTKLILNQDNLFILSDEEDAFINQLFLKYPKAKKFICNITASRKKQLKIDFIKSQTTLIEDMVNVIVRDNYEFFGSLSLQNLFLFVQFAKLFFEDEKQEIVNKFKAYMFGIYESRCKESHEKVAEKEERKRLSELELNKKLQEKNSKTLDTPVDVTLKNDGQSLKKKELPLELLEDLDFYFKNIDVNFSGDMDKLIECIKKIKGIYYKKSRFSAFNLKDQFFEILKKHGYILEEENVFVDSGNEEFSVDDSIKNFDLNFSGTTVVEELLGSVEMLDSLEKKIDVYIKILKELGFVFYKNEGKIMGRILKLSKSSSVFFTAFGNLISGIVRGTQLPEKKEKKWGTYSVYCYDIGKLGYRFVTLSVGDGSEMAIYDIMTHKAYVTFLDKKCN